MRRPEPVLALVILAACFGFPLLGASIAGRELDPIFQFPPSEMMPTDYPRFSWWAIALVFATGAFVIIPWMRMRMRTMSTPTTPPVPSRGGRWFPWWGWVALGWTLGWWALAWSRFEWFSWAQRYTFTPLWLGWIVTVNAVTWQRRGTCLMLRAPERWAGLFLASALFWWVFEWLNRFALNWHYRGEGDVGVVEYALHASVCFSTVLPAVAAGRELLGTLPGLARRLSSGPRWGWLKFRAAAVGLLAAGAAGLFLSGARPLYFYPALWVGPLLMGVGLAVLAGQRGWWAEIATGDWGNAGRWALSALMCGFFWELWNAHSLAHWIYTVPFVDRWHLFAMPLPGYAGYLPFGLECGFAATLVLSQDAVDGALAARL